MELINRNPSRDIDLPKYSRPKAKFYTREQALKLLCCIKGSVIEIPVILALCFGLRRGECLGLRWQDVNADKHTISICKNFTKTYTAVEGEPKNEPSRRTLIIPDFLRDYIYGQMENADSEYMCSYKGKRMMMSTLNGAFKRLLEKYNMPHIRFHDLRHSCASLLLLGGVNMKYIQYQMGHSTMNTTSEIYAHLSGDFKEQNADTMNRLMNGTTLAQATKS